MADLTLEQRDKVAELKWDTGVIKGGTAHVKRSYPDHPSIPQETVDQPNDGACLLTFDSGFEERVTVTVTGSQSGSQEETFTIT